MRCKDSQFDFIQQEVLIKLDQDGSIIWGETLLQIVILYDASDSCVQGAIAALNSLQSNFAIIQAVRKDRKNMNLLAIPEMQEWVRRIGYEV